MAEEEGDDCQDEDDGQPLFPPHGLVHPGSDPAPAPWGKVEEDRSRSRRLFWTRIRRTYWRVVMRLKLRKVRARRGRRESSRRSMVIETIT